MKNERKLSQALHDIITSELGDNDVKSTDFKTKGAKLDPVLRSQIVYWIASHVHNQ